MIFEGINFNEAHWKGKTEAEFIAHESHHSITKKQLKEAFGLMNLKPSKASQQAIQSKEKVS